MSAASKATPTHYGGFWRRLAAVLLDNFLYSAVSLPLLLMVFGPAYLRSAAQGWPLDDDPWRLLLRLFFAVLPYALIVGFWVRMGATPGKVLMECRVRDEHSGALPSMKQSLLRLLGYLVAGPLTLGLGFLWVIWDRRKQGLHDKIAGTVVRVEQDDYFYQTRPSMEQLACKH